MPEPLLPLGCIVMSDGEITDEVIEELEKGLEAGVHSSPSDPKDHQTVHHPEGTIHYYNDSGTWKDFPDE